MLRAKLIQKDKAVKKPLREKNVLSVKDMIMKALDILGGHMYLVKLAESQPGHFVKLLCMVVPREVAHSGVITGVSVQINTNLALGSGQAANQIQARRIEESETQYLVGGVEDDAE